MSTMAFIRPLRTDAILPQTKWGKTYIFTPNTCHFEPFHVYKIDLGLWLPVLPSNTLVKLTDMHAKFKLLTHYWTASCDELNILIFVTNAMTLQLNEPLCQCEFVSTMSLLPGKSCLLILLTQTPR